MNTPSSIYRPPPEICQFVPARVALMTNCVTPYTSPVWQKLSSSLRGLRLLLSTPMETDRHWDRNWDGLDVTLQKSVYARRIRKHAGGFLVTDHLHFPYDSLPLLFRYDPDVVISAQLGFRTLQAVLFRMIRRRSRLVLWVEASEHTEHSVGQIRTRVRQTLLNFADAVVVIGASGVRYLERIGIPSSKIIQAPHVTDPIVFHCTPLRQARGGVKKLLYVGRLIEGKGLEHFVAELSLWLRKNPGRTCDLLFVGDGPLLGLLQRLPVPPSLRLTFFGNVAYRELPEHYADTDVCIVPTFSDTWGLVVNEALASGVPVLGSLYSQAVDELIEDGVNGWRFYPDREGDVRKALDRVFDVKDCELNVMREAARQSVRYLTPEFSAQCFVRAIRLALDGLRPTVAEVRDLKSELNQ
jgi:glycosyltransferase involved in cell wall biosynthesis